MCKLMKEEELRSHARIEAERRAQEDGEAATWDAVAKEDEELEEMLEMQSQMTESLSNLAGLLEPLKSANGSLPTTPQLYTPTRKSLHSADTSRMWQRSPDDERGRGAGCEGGEVWERPRSNRYKLKSPKSSAGKNMESSKSANVNGESLAAEGWMCTQDVSVSECSSQASTRERERAGRNYEKSQGPADVTSDNARVCSASQNHPPP